MTVESRRFYSPVSKLSPKKKSKMVGLLGSPTRQFGIPSRDDDDTNKGDDDISVKNIATATPKINVLFSRSSTTILLGYFGGIEFLDNQTEFDATFGANPVMLPVYPTSANDLQPLRCCSILVNNIASVYIYMHVGNYMLEMLQLTRIQV